MKNNIHFIIITLCIFLSIFSCSKSENVDSSSDYSNLIENINPKGLESDFIKWWTYFSDNIVLSADFIPLDTAMNTISKLEFINRLCTGTYIPIKLISNDSISYLKLYSLSNEADNTIVNTIKNEANQSLKKLKMEGVEFPSFNFESINGEKYNNDNLMGKVIVLKCWFIACQACVEEFPELNELVNRSKNRGDIKFISFAYDSPESLANFILRKPFKYDVISVDRGFLESELSVYTYPTHFIINKNGVIEKVVNSYSELESALQKY